MVFMLQNWTTEVQRTSPYSLPDGNHTRVRQYVQQVSARFRAGRKSLVDDPRPGQANAVTGPISSTSEKWLPCHIANVGFEDGCQGWNSVSNYSQQTALSESVRALGSEATHWSAKRIEYGDRTSTSFSVSWNFELQGFSFNRVTCKWYILLKHLFRMFQSSFILKECQN